MTLSVAQDLVRYHPYVLAVYREPVTQTVIIITEMYRKMLCDVHLADADDKRYSSYDALARALEVSPQNLQSLITGSCGPSIQVRSINDWRHNPNKEATVLASRIR